MTALEKQAAAAAATTEAQKAIRAARATLERDDLWVNGYGIYRYPLMAEQVMTIAIRQLETARKIMADTNWPDDADYDAAEREQIARWEEEDRQ